MVRTYEEKTNISYRT